MKKILAVLAAAVICSQLFGQSYMPGKLTVILSEQALQGMVRNSNGTATLPNAGIFNTLAQSLGVLATRPMSPKPNSAFRKFFELEFPANANVQNIANTLANNPLVEWARPIPADQGQPLGPYYPPDAKFSNDQMWYVHQGTDKADVNGPEAWEWTLGSPNVVIAICGGGINWLTPNYYQSDDVAANLWTNPGEIANNGIDDDGNGFVDDIHGWNFYPYSGHPNGDNDIEYIHNPWADPLWWHGTPMASEAASAIDNCTSGNCGVGVAPNCRIMGVPHNDAPSIVYATDNGAKVFVYGFRFNTDYFVQFIEYAYNAGMLFVNAAGNYPPTTVYQSSYGVSVCTLDSTNAPVPPVPGCSVTGSLVKLAAPALYCGSSYAAPVAGGVAALMRSFNPYIPIGDLRTIFMSTKSCNSVPYPGTGAGRIDAFKAVQNIGATPTLKSLSGNYNEHPLLNWDPNPFASILPIDQYVVQRKRHYMDETSFSDIGVVSSATTSYLDQQELVGRLLGEHSPPTEYRVRARLNYSGNFVLSVPSNMLNIWTHSPTGLDGSGGQAEKIPAQEATPKQTRLFPNYPNPFNPSTVLRFDVSEAGIVSLKVFDLLGQEVATIVNEPLDAGSYQKTFDASSLSSGVYFYRLQAGAFSATSKFLFSK